MKGWTSRALFKKAGASKYGAKGTRTEDGIYFSSRLEARRWEQLKILQEAGSLSDLKRQPKVLLTLAAVVYHPDFSYTENGVEIFEETKGFETADYLIKKKLWKVYGPGVLRVLKSDRSKGIKMVEEIHPKRSAFGGVDL